MTGRVRAFGLAAAAIAALDGGAAWAHDGHPLLVEAAHRWPGEPVTIALLVVSAFVYGAGVRALWHSAGTGGGIRPWQVAAFATGLAMLAAALLSPLVWLSEVLFSAHMSQHEILMLVAAPLLVFGQPALALLWALPRGWREGWSRWPGRRPVSRPWHLVTSPLAAFALHGATLWAWHAPVLWEAALRSTAVHAVQHLSFVLTAALFWWGMVNGRYGKGSYGASVVYVFLTAVHGSLLGALLTVGSHVWYPSYAAAAAVWRIDALEDQQLAGLLMWIPCGVVFITFGLALFAAWLGDSERRVMLGRVAR